MQWILILKAVLESVHHDDYFESVHLFHCALVPISASIACTHLDDHIHIYCARRNMGGNHENPYFFIFVVSLVMM